MAVKKFLSVVAIIGLAGCQSVGYHKAAVQANEGENLSVGKVQREVKVGMSSAEVVHVLGSPNIVTTDDQRRESWVYDKIATDKAYSASSGGVNALILGGGSALGAGFGFGGASSSGATSTSQRTLTVIIKFDEKSKVRDFAYHTSRF